MKNIHISILFLIALFIVNSCTLKRTIILNKKVETLNSTIDVFPTRINCWVDRMPGKRMRMQITGEIDIPSSKNYNLKFIQLKRVHIYQKKKLLVAIKPRVRKNNRKSNPKNLHLLFTTTSGVSPSPELNLRRKVNIELVFTDNNNDYSYFIKNYKIDVVQ